MAANEKRGDVVWCAGCRAQLARRDGDEITIRRGELQVTIVGEYVASFVCYVPSCRTLNVFRPPAARRAVPGGPGG